MAYFLTASIHQTGGRLAARSSEVSEEQNSDLDFSIRAKILQ